MRINRLNEKIATLNEEMKRLEAVEKQRLAEPDQQISFTDPDARSMATSGRGSGIVGYNVQTAVDTRHHLIIAHEVTASRSDRAQLAPMSKLAKKVLGVDQLEVVADRGYFTSEQILECAEAGITVTVPKPQTSNNRARGQFGKPDFRYVASEDMYICPAGEACLQQWYNLSDPGADAL
jgi:transposase